MTIDSNNAIVKHLAPPVVWDLLTEWSRQWADRILGGKPPDAVTKIIDRLDRDLPWVRTFVWQSSFPQLCAHMQDHPKGRRSPLQYGPDDGKPDPENEILRPMGELVKDLQDFDWGSSASAPAAWASVRLSAGLAVAKVTLDDGDRIRLVREFVEALHSRVAVGRSKQ